MSKTLRVVMLAGDNESSMVMCHALENNFDIVQVIIEDPVSRKKLLRNRIKNLGYLEVIGQILFMLCNKLLVLPAYKRMEEIEEQYSFDSAPIEIEKVIRVSSINEERVADLLKAHNPDAVVVNGTRIISGEVLDSIEAPFINTHAGITPKYRGVHGGYWALASDDAAHCGVTVHLVDPGIDTGDILYQKKIKVTKKDSFNTYPLLQMGAAIPLMRQALYDVENNTISPKKVDLPSRLWYHPTLWGYIAIFLKRGVK